MIPWVWRRRTSLPNIFSACWGRVRCVERWHWLVGSMRSPCPTWRIRWAADRKMVVQTSGRHDYDSTWQIFIRIINSCTRALRLRTRRISIRFGGRILSGRLRDTWRRKVLICWSLAKLMEFMAVFGDRILVAVMPTKRLAKALRLRRRSRN